MGRQDGGGGDAGGAERPPCGLCGGAITFSHKEHVRRGEVRLVFRCRGCGNTSSHVTSGSGGDDKGRMGKSKKAPVDEGPPQNRVLDPALAKLLLEQLGDGADGSAP